MLAVRPRLSPDTCDACWKALTLSASRLASKPRPKRAASAADHARALLRTSGATGSLHRAPRQPAPHCAHAAPSKLPAHRHIAPAGSTCSSSASQKQPPHASSSSPSSPPPPPSQESSQSLEMGVHAPRPLAAPHADASVRSHADGTAPRDRLLS